MGMAASQARLLSLTARLNDVEFKAQSLQSQKLALATQRDELYQNYCAALDATEFKVAYVNNNGKEILMDANFNSLCTYNKNRKVDYALVDNETDKIIVTKEIKEAYDKYGSKDKYAFAWAAMGYADDTTWDPVGGSILTQLGIGNYGNGSDSPKGTVGDNRYMTDVEWAVYEEMKGTYPELETKYNDLLKATEKDKQKELLKDFRDELYSKCGEELWDGVNRNKNNKDDVVYNQPNLDWGELEAEFKYYTRIWDAINEAGGCVTIDKHNEAGEQGNDWFYNMVKAGQVGIKFIEKNNDDTWDDTSIATSVNENYLQETDADEKTIKKAEAEYEYELNILNRKDTNFDTELSKLETERTTITTEMESIKKVKNDNIERTFGIFS